MPVEFYFVVVIVCSALSGMHIAGCVTRRVLCQIAAVNCVHGSITRNVWLSRLLLTIGFAQSVRFVAVTENT